MSKMGSGRFIKTKANYTLKKKHLDTSLGSIMERDYMTITGSPENNSNFKFIHTFKPNLQKKHKRVEADIIENVNDSTLKVSNKPKLNFEKISDFAYYGSAYEYLKASISGIILKYPVSIEINDKTNEYFVFTGDDGTKYGCGEFRNDFLIDFFSTGNNDKSNYSKYRFFSKHFLDYEYSIDGAKFYSVDSWKSETFERSQEEWIDSLDCENYNIIYRATLSSKENGAPVIIIEKKARHSLNNEWYYTCYIDNLNTPAEKVSIRLKRTIFNQEYDKLDDFQKYIVNIGTTPLFTSTFLKRIETETGNVYINKKYTWPTFDGVNPDISSGDFAIYISSLTELAEESDETDSDNIWRSMTHEAIKNLDWTFIKEKGDSSENEIIDNSRIKSILRLWGRQYDEIKKYIDSIGERNSITYNEKNNAPEDTWGESLEMSGWDIRLPISYSNCFVNGLYPKYNKKMTYKDANKEFFKRLKINTKKIFTQKGSKQSIRSILSIFGFSPDEYIITESIGVAKPISGENYPESDKVLFYNNLKDTKIIKEEENPFGEESDFQGLAIKNVSLEGGESKDYVIPWFNNGEKYDRDPYFQMKGGWGNLEYKNVTNPITGEINTILPAKAKFGLYDETYPLLKVLFSLTDIGNIPKNELNEGDIIYVVDLNEVLTEYNFGPGENDDISNFSHYFMLKNEKNKYFWGYATNGNVYGWKNVSVESFKNEDSPERPDAERVMYIESLKDDTSGNNPHNGNLHYDDGASYIKYFSNLFDKNDFSSLSDEDLKKLENENLGFNIEELPIKNKCMYFRDRLSKDKEVFSRENNGKTIDNFAYDDSDFQEYRKKYDILFNPEKIENGRIMDDESSANSVVNLKRIKISFVLPKFTEKKSREKKSVKESKDSLKKEFENYVLNDVMFYVKQIIPSTSILECNFISKDLLPGRIEDIYSKSINKEILNIKEDDGSSL